MATPTQSCSEPFPDPRITTLVNNVRKTRLQDSMPTTKDGDARARELDHQLRKAWGGPYCPQEYAPPRTLPGAHILYPMLAITQAWKQLNRTLWDLWKKDGLFEKEIQKTTSRRLTENVAKNVRTAVDEIVATQGAIPSKASTAQAKELVTEASTDQEGPPREAHGTSIPDPISTPSISQSYSHEQTLAGEGGLSTHTENRVDNSGARLNSIMGQIPPDISTGSRGSIHARQNLEFGSTTSIIGTTPRPPVTTPSSSGRIQSSEFAVAPVNPSTAEQFSDANFEPPLTPGAFSRTTNRTEDFSNGPRTLKSGAYGVDNKCLKNAHSDSSFKGDLSGGGEVDPLFPESASVNGLTRFNDARFDNKQDQ